MYPEASRRSRIVVKAVILYCTGLLKLPSLSVHVCGMFVAVKTSGVSDILCSLPDSTVIVSDSPYLSVSVKTDLSLYLPLSSPLCEVVFNKLMSSQNL